MTTFEQFSATNFLESVMTIAGNSVAFTFENADAKKLMINMPLAVFAAFAFAVEHRAKQIEQETGKAILSSSQPPGRRQ